MTFARKTITYKVPDTDVIIRLSQDTEGDVDIEIQGDNGSFDFALYLQQDTRTIAKLGFPVEPPPDVTVEGGTLEKLEEFIESLPDVKTVPMESMDRENLYE
jgi:hypothetical protein